MSKRTSTFSASFHLTFSKQGAAEGCAAPKTIVMRLFFLSLVGAAVLASCNAPCPECPEADLTAYEKNQATMEAMFAGFAEGKVDPSMFAEDFKDVGTGLNESDRGKAEAMEQYSMFTSMLTMDLEEAMYLPGVDTVNFALDGSVRYYGKWNMQMGEASQRLMTYGSMNFNAAGEITELAHYADWTATFNALLAENPEIMEQMMAAQAE